MAAHSLASKNAPFRLALKELLGKTPEELSSAFKNMGISSHTGRFRVPNDEAEARRCGMKKSQRFPA
jgi:hypothetical protein